MDPLPVEVYSPAQVRAMDRYAIDVAGIPGIELMRRAGAAAFASLRRHWPEARRIAVLCGGGNNGGDGYVVAQLARAAGGDVTLYACVAPARLAGEAALAHAAFVAGGGSPESWRAGGLAGCDLVVDALLGTGLDRPVEGAMRDTIGAVNDSSLPVLSLDIPSGLDAHTGLAQGVAVRATRTMCFVGLKSGLFLGDGRDCRGLLEFDGLDLPPAARANHVPVLRRMDRSLLDIALPARRAGTHKGENGRVLVIGGHAMAGAACLAGEAALRAGAGLVTVGTAASQAAAIVAARPELIVKTAESPQDAEALAAAADAVAIGPGLGLDARGDGLMQAAIASGKPLVVDADALTLLARQPRRYDGWLLTPHAGEAARLLGTDAASVERDRIGALNAIATLHGGACVLKGACSLVGDGHAVPFVCDRGNAGMATAGAGDVLTGIAAALLASGVDRPPAAAAAVLLHAMAGDAAAAGGPRGAIAGDFIAALRSVVNPPWP